MLLLEWACESYEAEVEICIYLVHLQFDLRLHDLERVICLTIDQILAVVHTIICTIRVETFYITLLIVEPLYININVFILVMIAIFLLIASSLADRAVRCHLELFSH